MKFDISRFKGMLPIFGRSKLPEDYATYALNAKISSGDLEAYADLGNPLQLAKAAIINTVWKIAGVLYLQWRAAELQNGAPNVDVTYGTIPGDSSYRAYFTGLDVPRVTTLFYATDPSQQGTNPASAYPYVSFPLGVANPVTAPTVYVPASTATTTEYDYAAQASVNNAALVNPGTEYSALDVLNVIGGTVPPGLHGAQILVETVDANGAILTYSLQSSGFYTQGNGPPVTADPVMGGTGTGATFNLTVVSNSFTGFGVASYDNGAGSYIHWTISSGALWTVATGQGDLAAAYSLQNFGLSTAASFVYQADIEADSPQSPDLLVEFAGTFDGARNIAGPTVVLSVADGAFFLASNVQGSNGNSLNGTIVQRVSYAAAANVIYRVTVNATANNENANSTSGFNVVATLALASAPTSVLATVQGFVAYNGEQIGVATNHRGDHDSASVGYFQNLLLMVTQPVDDTNSESTNYVYQWVQQYPGDTATQISGPSNPSNTVSVFINSKTTPASRAPATVTIPVAPTGQYITMADLFRLVNDSGVETYTFVKRIAVSTATTTQYVDSAMDAAIGPGTLISQDFAPPPAGLQGISAGPNGVLGGFIAGTNTFCFSAPNYPYSWPLTNRYPAVAPAVGGAWIDSTWIGITQANPYTIFGEDPANYSMTKEVQPQGGTSKRSLAFHRRLGVIFASGSGLYAYRGQGQIQSLTKDRVFSYEQWQALNPASIIGVVFNDQYWFWYDTGTVKGGYVLELQEETRGVVALDFHITAVYVDPINETLVMVPDLSTFPIGAAPVTAPQNTLWQWEGATTLRPYVWERQDELYRRPVSFPYGRVRSETSPAGSLVFTASSETGPAIVKANPDQKPFPMAPVPGIRWGMRFTGTETVNEARLAESAEEMLQ